MNWGLLLRLGAIGAVMLFLIVPLVHVHELIRERQAARNAVVQDIARSAAYAQTLTGPILIVPYTRTVQEEQLDAAHRPYQVTHEVEGELRLLPATFDVRGNLTTQERQRGIYRARVFDARTSLSGRFEVPANFGVTADVQSYRFGQPRLVLGISDIRGIGNALSLQANGQSIPFVPGTGTSLLGAGVQAPLNIAGAAAPVAFQIELQLQGTSDFQITPVGRDTHVMLTSDWPHPSFVGEFLPRAREVTGAGFSAEWQTSYFATNLEEALSRCRADEASPADPKNQSCADFTGRHFGVSFIDPVDQYLKSERAVKYGFLFIALTFAGFFLMEVLRRASVHPVQYGLVGLALAMFFLLLLSFSEHIGFAAAFLVSAAACVGVITYYVTHVLGSRAQGAGFGAALAVLYALLYAILSSEDYALLTGSVLVFALLTLVMVLTRRVNWFGIGQPGGTVHAGND
jgi:inner membrane protein